MLTVGAPELRGATRRIFAAAGTPSDLAGQFAEILVESNVAGHDSHGVIRIPAHLEAIKDGVIVPEARPAVIEETAGSALADGKDGFGHIAAAFATDVAARKTRENKAAVVWTCRSSRGPTRSTRACSRSPFPRSSRPARCPRWRHSPAQAKVFIWVSPPSGGGRHHQR